MPSVGRSRLRALLRWIAVIVCNPVATLILLGVLGLLVLFVPARAVSSTPGWRGYWARRMHMTNYVQGQVYAVRDDAGWTLSDPNSESWDRMTRILAERPSDVIRFDWRLGVTRSGLWAPTLQREAYTLVVVPMGSAPPPDGLAGARAAADAVIGQRLGSRFPGADALVSAGGGVRERRIWLGYAYDAAAVVTGALIACSLAWVPRVVRSLRAGRAGRRLARGRCPTCNYAFAGLPGDTCPECGGALPPDRTG